MKSITRTDHDVDLKVDHSGAFVGNLHVYNVDPYKGLYEWQELNNTYTSIGSEAPILRIKYEDIGNFANENGDGETGLLFLDYDICLGSRVIGVLNPNYGDATVTVGGTTLFPYMTVVYDDPPYENFEEVQVIEYQNFTSGDKEEFTPSIRNEAPEFEFFLDEEYLESLDERVPDTFGTF